MLNKNAVDRDSFEQLCCLLAYKEFSHLGKFTRIDGSGGDGGVECYITLDSGEERGMQSKFFTRLGSSQKKQIEDSLIATKKNHPNLKRWILCLPIDLTDSIIKGSKTTNGERPRFEAFKKKNKEISIEERFLFDINNLLTKYSNIDNAFFNPDPVKRKEALISSITNDLDKKTIAKQKAKEQNKNVEKVFINGDKNDIERSRAKYLQYNLSKFRFVDHFELWSDIEKIENNININNLDNDKYSNFRKDFQQTISNYFCTYNPPLAELSPIYKYVFSDIGQQIGGVLSIGIDGRFIFDNQDGIYYMKIQGNE